MACHGGADASRTETVTDHDMHGAAQPFLLSALVAGETPANSQEGLCFACHDGNGPAATDVESMFAGTATSISGSGALVNTHHDITDADQAYSGAVIECTSCHDPHGAHLLTDPDADGTPAVAGTTWPGSNLVSETCLQCHDNSFGPNVTAPTNPLVDILDDWVDLGGSDKAAQHGGDAGGPTVVLRPGSGYARFDILQCTDCHNAGHGTVDGATGNVYTNLFNLKAIVYSKDGSTALTPDFSWPGPTPAYIVRLLDVSAANDNALTNGRAWCSTCHPNPMNGTKGSGCISAACHQHGANSF